MKLLLNTATDPAFNLALEEVVSAESRGELFMLWRNRSAIIVGCNQNTEAEIDAEFVRQHHIDVVRRITGGGAVYHDLGNVNYTIAANDRLLEPEAFARNAQVMLDVLHDFGVDAEFSGRNDILVGGRKVSGSAKNVLPKRTLFHATLLFDVDLEMLVNALHPDESKIRAKGIKSLRSRVANLREFLPQWNTEEFLHELTQALLARFHQEVPEYPTAAQIAAAEALADSKYRTWEWNYGSHLSYSYTQNGRFKGGSVHVSFNIVGNRISELLFSGDFFGRRPVAELAAQLNGLPPQREAIEERLKALPVEEYLQGITAADLLTLFKL